MPTRTCPAATRDGFTLIELMIVVAIIGLAMSVTVTGSKALLPQSRLRSSANSVGSTLELARSHAQLRQEPLVFAYDLEHDTYEAYYPYERDEEGVNKGPGKTSIIDVQHLEEGVSFRCLRLPGSVPRTDGVVPLEISPLGRIQPHEVVVENPEYADTEVLTLRVSGLANRSQILEGDVVMAPLQDVDFH